MSAKTPGEQVREAVHELIGKEHDAPRLRAELERRAWTPQDWESVAEGLDSTVPWVEQVTDFPNWLRETMPTEHELETAHQVESRRREKARERELVQAQVRLL